MTPQRESPWEPKKEKPPPKRRWWLWGLGFLLLLALCDDDDDRRASSNCYNFGDERLCFQEPLPSDKHCYLEADGEVRCYDQPL